MTGPSRNWREIVAADEEQRFTRYAEELTRLQRQKSQSFGTGRALHRKQLLGLEAELEILPDLPLHAQYGLFAKAGMYKALVRLSNGSMSIQHDRKPDIRGFAIKVQNLDGAGALGGRTEAQDFLLINREVFGLKNSEQFVKLVFAAAKGGSAVIRHFVGEYGLLGGLKKLIASGKSMKRPFSGFATERFFSAAPIACGPYAVRVRLLPPENQKPQEGASEDWAQDYKKRLEKGSLRYALQLQFFVSEAVTPIEDGSVNWDERDAPYVTVAYLTVCEPKEGTVALQRTIEELAFDPWCALVEHRPLGDVMRARKYAYYTSQQARRQTKS